MTEIVDVHGTQRRCLWPLFGTFPALSGIVAAVIEGDMGVALTDHPSAPRVAALTLNFVLVAGDPGSPHAGSLLRRPRGAIACDAQWEELFTQQFGDGLVTFPRTAFEPGRWDTRRLETFAGSLWSDFAIRRMNIVDAMAFGGFDPPTLQNFGSPEALVRDGFGFVARKESTLAAGVATYAIGGGRVEIEIHTHERFRRQGLATALGAKMVLEYLARDLEPCWDASNPEAAALGEKLGFRRITEYRAWRFPTS